MSQFIIFNNKVLMTFDNKVNVIFPKVETCTIIERLLKWLVILNIEETFIMREESFVIVLETNFFLLTGEIENM